MSAWAMTLGTLCGLVALVAATVLIILTQVETKQQRPRWLIPGLSLIACSGMILYGGSLLSTLYIQMTHIVSVMGPP